MQSVEWGVWSGESYSEGWSGKCAEGSVAERVGWGELKAKSGVRGWKSRMGNV